MDFLQIVYASLWCISIDCHVWVFFTICITTKLLGPIVHNRVWKIFVGRIFCWTKHNILCSTIFGRAHLYWKIYHFFGAPLFLKACYFCTRFLEHTYICGWIYLSQCIFISMLFDCIQHVLLSNINYTNVIEFTMVG